MKTPPSASPAAKASDKGKVIHDDRGNAKWDLGLDTARVNKLTTSQLLKKLDVSELSLLDEHGQGKEPHAKPGGGFEPYEAAQGRAKPPSAAPPTAATKPLAKRATPNPRPTKSRR